VKETSSQNLTYLIDPQPDTAKCVMCGSQVPTGNALHSCSDGQLRDSLGRLPLPTPAEEPEQIGGSIDLSPKHRSGDQPLRAAALIFSLVICLPGFLICAAMISLTDYFNWWWPSLGFGILGWFSFWYALGGLKQSNTISRILGAKHISTSKPSQSSPWYIQNQQVQQNWRENYRRSLKSKGGK